ncbi:4526_t:CDS:2 [Gigaspora margarita]|uniref:4526_t:CDS:1 n=1 Tax=Gigaspora margarita TaxID=4874 RepID=A0ABN7V875_GIGMA|nr:4526_t:CDS:2 [Gigaspora margarita]
MNPIKIKEYEVYKDTQKRNKNKLQWYEFLNLDKKQYLNFRNVRPPAQKRKTSNTQIENVFDQDSIDEMIDYTRDSDTFTFKIASTKAKKCTLLLPNKNARRPVQKYTNYINIKSISNQEGIHEMTNHTQDSVTSNLENNIPREDYDIENTD